MRRPAGLKSPFPEGSLDESRTQAVSGINFDLIFGLLFLSVESLFETVKVSAAMRPDRVALFG